MGAKSSKARERLTRARVVQTAVALADAGGVGSLSMRKLAKALGVEAMSLYHHVANKEEILDSMVDAVFGEIEFSPEAEWKQAMRERANSVRAVLRRHPWALGLLESRKNPGPNTLGHHDAVIGCLRRAGFSVAMTSHAFSLIDSYLYGFALQELNMPFENTAQLEVVAEDMLAAMPADAYPNLIEMMQMHVLQPGYSYGDEFAIGFGVVLDGIERMALAAGCKL